jgi:hypothetical protein
MLKWRRADETHTAPHARSSVARTTGTDRPARQIVQPAIAAWSSEVLLIAQRSVGNQAVSRILTDRRDAVGARSPTGRVTTPTK